jgi:hypothetical protein
MLPLIWSESLLQREWKIGRLIHRTHTGAQQVTNNAFMYFVEVTQFRDARLAHSNHRPYNQAL